MRVYEKRPSGFAPPDLVAHARRHVGAAAFAVARVLVGLVLAGLAGFPLGVLWLAVGLLLIASGFLFVRDAGRAALERPALVLTGLPKWDGVRRTSWEIEADDAGELGRRLADGLDAELGPSLTAFDEGAEYRGTTRGQAFDPAARYPAIVAWGVGHAPRLAATDDADGVWLRTELAGGDGRRSVTVLANTGRAVEALKLVAWRT